MMSYKVLYLIDRLGRGGAAQVVTNLALGVDREKFTPIVCTTRLKPAHGQDQLLVNAGIQLIQLNRESRIQLKAWNRLWRILPEISILHAHESGSGFWARTWGKLFQVPIIITHDHTSADVKRPIVRLGDRLTHRLSDRVVTVSNYNRDLSIMREKYSPNRVSTVYNGIDLVRFSRKLDMKDARRCLGLPLDKKLLVVIARLVPEKNHVTLFHALSMLPLQLSSQCQCLIVGNGDTQPELKRLAHELRLTDNVTFIGERNDVHIILQAADLMVLPSKIECLPMTILEALATECPIVATNVGGIPEVIEQVGWPLVSPNSPRELAIAITKVLSISEYERSRLIKTGRNVVREKFSQETMIAQVESLYNTLLEEKLLRKVN